MSLPAMEETLGDMPYNTTTHCPFWSYDDIPHCARSKYINYLTPLLLLILTGAFVLFNIWTRYYRYDVLRVRKDDFIEQLMDRRSAGIPEDEPEDEHQPMLSSIHTRYSSIMQGVPSKKTEADLLMDRHFAIEKIRFLKLNGEPHGVPHLVTRDYKEKMRVACEFVLVLLQFFIHLVIYLHRDKPVYRQEFDYKGVLVNCIMWTWLLLVICLRVWNINQRASWVKKYPGNLWAVSFISYLFLFFSMIMPLRTVLIHHIKSKLISNYYITQFIINTVLFLLLFFAPVKNSFTISYKTGPNVHPSPEPTTSIAGFICWGWIDGLIWEAHRHIINKEDVWGLSMQDYSIFVVKNFRKFTKLPRYKNKKFSFNLLWYFRYYILLQGFWACVSSLLSFAPTLLLKKILEYVDNPGATPASVAWFYVLSMFGCKLLVAVATGQALFFGRRVCIRMRSIIISEIYAKALRKKIIPTTKADTPAIEDGNSGDDDNAKAKARESRSKDAEDENDPQILHDEEEINGDEESTKSSAKIGGIINLMAIDSFKISEICAYLHSFVEATIMTVIALVLLYNLLGIAGFVGFGVILMVLPINFKLANLIGYLQKKNLGITDERIQKLNEALQAIRIIKFFSWEDNFEKDIMAVRELELKYLVYRSVTWVVMNFFWFLTPILVSSLSFTFYISVQGNTLTTPVAFTAISLFGLLRDPLDRLADMISFVIQSKVSLDRVADFLGEADTEKYRQLTVDPQGRKIAFENATVAWGTNTQDFQLRHLNIRFETGKLNVVIGPTGSGKTSLLMALLGEMHLVSGKVVVPSLTPRQDLVADNRGFTNSIAYCSQAAWLLNDTIRNNILFNSPYDENRYNDVVVACGLKRDFEILKAGDFTEIGEKGIALSGGQKQRVSLARALYSNCRHLLLDDCLSAVDSHTASWIYDNCITGPLMQGRTCILVSHNVALTLRNADLVVMLENGTVAAQGTPEELLDKGVLGEDELVRSTIASRSASSSNLATRNRPPQVGSPLNPFKPSSLSKRLDKLKQETSQAAASEQGDDRAANEGAFTSVSGSANAASAITTAKAKEDEAERVAEGKLITEETKAEGTVSIDVYGWYLKIFGGFKTIFLLLIIYFTAQLADIGQAVWIRNWVTKHTVAAFIYSMSSLNDSVVSAAAHIRSNMDVMLNKVITLDDSMVYVDSTTGQTVHTTKYYLVVYFLIGLLGAISGSSETLFTYLTGIKASRKIFKVVLYRVMHGTLRFFDTTPVGRIMNRLSKDIESVDQDLAPYLNSVVYYLIECLSTVVLITVITPKFLSVAILVSCLYYLLGYFYMRASRELKRLDSVTKSPIYQHFSETLVGVTTIRAYGDESRFLQENLAKIDENNGPFFYLWVANRWLSFRIDMIGALVVLGSGIFILWNINNLDSGLAGISLSYAITFTQGALWLVRCYSEVEMNMNAVERLKEYMEIDQEPYKNESSNAIEPPVDWPQEGRIEVNDLSLRYAPRLPKVIKNVSFIVDPKSKVGIVGRTGAGKSTIITALFRFLDPETGYIKIDNIDIKSLDLPRLRRSITIIPQDPTLFTGTVKSNLDPYGEYTDNEIYEALRRVNLITDEELELVRSNMGNPVAAQPSATAAAAGDNDDAASTGSTNANKFLDLNAEITEGGGNLSQGQRQLLCLARSLLRAPRILLLDEATASIDYESDAKIQETIRSEFSESTILTIAHRLRSVIDYDKILVMDAGEVKEYDHPYSLLLDKNSLFYDMCQHSGELDALIESAKAAFVRKLNSK